MFGFLKPRLAPDGPVEFRFDIIIARPAEDVYALIDWADPRNGKRQLGNQITNGDAPDRFTLVLQGVPGHRFEIAVEEETPHVAYAFTCEAVPMAGRLQKSHELYRFEPLTGGSCRLTLVTTATLVGARRMKDFEEEVLMMSVACHNALAKLRIHAEEGTEAARAADDRLIA